MRKRVYVAGSSAELQRAKQAMMSLRQFGHTVTHDWVTSVQLVGSANPTGATHYDRLCWSQDDLDGIERADVFWLLYPCSPSFGAGVELGFAYSQRKHLVVSGAHLLTSVFTALAQSCYPCDDDALVAEFGVAHDT